MLVSPFGLTARSLRALAALAVVVEPASSLPNRYVTLSEKRMTWISPAPAGCA